MVKPNLSLKTVRQGSSGLEMKPTKATLNAKKVFELCFGDVPTSSQGVYFVNECGAPSDGQLGVYDRDSGGGLPIGDLDFDLANAVETTTGGGLTTKSITVPVVLVIDCALTEVAVRGIAQIGFKDIGAVQQCMTSVKLKFSGAGDVEGLGGLLIDEGSSITSTGSAFLLPVP